MNSSPLLILGALGSVIFPKLVWSADAVAAQRPNLVVFLVDDMGIMDTSVPFLTDAGGTPVRYPLNDYYRTPAMERLAARGIRFNNFCAMSVCSPTRISLLTGQNAARHGTTNWINPDQNNGGPQGPPHWNWDGLQPGSVTLSALLKSAGYRTIHAGKGHFSHRSLPGADPSTLGFDVSIAGASIGAPGSYFGTKGYGAGTRNAVPGLEKYHGTDTFLTDALTQEVAVHVTDAVRSETPFFLYFAHYAVHAPFDSDPRFAAHYAASGHPAPAQAFATLIEGMDRSLGQLLDLLDSLDVAGNTLILFLGDNGSDAPLGHQHEVACAAPLRGRKGAHYEGGMRVPFIAAWAGEDPDSDWQKQLPIPGGAVQNQLAAVQDVFPTLLPLAGVQLPQNHVVDGQSLDVLLTGKPDAGRTQSFLMHYPHSPHRSDYWSSLRDQEWKVIYHYFPSEVSGGSHYQLFNLQSDPFEQKDLSATHPAELQSMMTRLIRELDQHGALYPVESPNGREVRPIPPHD